jgi:hypothetical protein
MRAAVMGMALALTTGAPAAGTLATPAVATVEASAQDNRQRVIKFWDLHICWKRCPGYGICCYDNPHM